MKVGGVAETVIVSGEAPTVDVTSTRNQQVISGQTVADIPSSRQYSAFTQLVPAINVQAADIEGSNPALYSVFQIHGGRRNEGQVLVDGMNGGYQGMGVSGYVPEVANSQEVVFSLSGGLGEATTGGPQMNIIGKQGGNRFAGSVFVSGTGSGLQGTNLDAAIKYFTTSVKQKSIAFLLSDFLTTGYENDLKVIGNKHDVIGIRVYDKMDMQLPDAGLLQVQDAESGKTQWIDSSNAMVRYNYQQHFMQQSEICKNYFRKSGSELLHVRTDDDYVKILQQFFIKRN